MKKTALLLSLLGLLGCGQVEIPPSAIEIPAFFDGAGEKEGEAADLSCWWRSFQDPVLNRLVEEALLANADLRMAAANVRAARALAEAEESRLFPSVYADGAVWRGDGDWNIPYMREKTRGQGLALGAGWEPDIFGRLQASSDAAESDALGARDLEAGVRLMVIAEVAGNYREARGLEQRIALLDQGLRTIRLLLRYAEGRHQAGQALAFDVDMIRERLKTMEARRPVLIQLLETRERRLMTLRGKPPEGRSALPQGAPGPLPDAPGGVVPVDLLERRPDVRARLQRVFAEAARLKVAKADLLPRFGIEFLGYDGRLRFSGLPALEGSGGLVGLSVHLPIFTAGRIRAVIKARDALLEGAVAAYDRTLLQALEEVENAYGARRSLDLRRADLLRSQTLLDANAARAQSLYEAGRKTLQDALEAKLELIARQDDIAQTDMARADAAIQLYRALGGGWAPPLSEGRAFIGKDQK